MDWLEALLRQLGISAPMAGPGVATASLPQIDLKQPFRRPDLGVDDTDPLGLKRQRDDLLRRAPSDTDPLGQRKLFRLPAADDVWSRDVNPGRKSPIEEQAERDRAFLEWQLRAIEQQRRGQVVDTGEYAGHTVEEAEERERAKPKPPDPDSLPGQGTINYAGSPDRPRDELRLSDEERRQRWLDALHEESWWQPDAIYGIVPPHDYSDPYQPPPPPEEGETLPVKPFVPGAEQRDLDPKEIDLQRQFFPAEGQQIRQDNIKFPELGLYPSLTNLDPRYRSIPGPEPGQYAEKPRDRAAEGAQELNEIQERMRLAEEAGDLDTWSDEGIAFQYQRQHVERLLREENRGATLAQDDSGAWRVQPLSGAEFRARQEAMKQAQRLAGSPEGASPIRHDPHWQAEPMPEPTRTFKLTPEEMKLNRNLDAYNAWWEKHSGVQGEEARVRLGKQADLIERLEAEANRLNLELEVDDNGRARIITSFAPDRPRLRPGVGGMETGRLRAGLEGPPAPTGPEARPPQHTLVARPTEPLPPRVERPTPYPTPRTDAERRANLIAWGELPPDPPAPATVVNLRTAQGQKVAQADPNYVYIGRGQRGEPTLFGNPWVVGRDVRTREEAVERYRQWLLGDERLDAEAQSRGFRRPTPEEIEQLRGKTLGCFDKPHACHGDVLVEILAATQRS